MEKIDSSSARRRLKSRNIKTRKRALKLIKQAKTEKKKKMVGSPV
ncbi:putative metal homeostasis protein [Carnobacterium gallinarum]|nr:putative metal homeostasis protein [Carnobacterium gallinarum]